MPQHIFSQSKLVADAIVANGRTTCEREIADNVASIKACPERVLSGHDRTFALHWARQGYDVYAYTSGGSIGTWCLWLADRRIPLGPATAPADGGEGGDAA